MYRSTTFHMRHQMILTNVYTFEHMFGNYWRHELIVIYWFICSSFKKIVNIVNELFEKLTMLKVIIPGDAQKRRDLKVAEALGSMCGGLKKL